MMKCNIDSENTAVWRYQNLYIQYLLDYVLLYRSHVGVLVSGQGDEVIISNINKNVQVCKMFSVCSGETQFFVLLDVQHYVNAKKQNVFIMKQIVRVLCCWLLFWAACVFHICSNLIYLKETRLSQFYNIWLCWKHLTVLTSWDRRPHMGTCWLCCTYTSLCSLCVYAYKPC